MASESGSLRRDIVSAYLVTGSRVLAWIIVTAAVFRAAGKPAFGLLALILSTIGALEYTALGLGPAIIHFTGQSLRKARLQSSDNDHDLHQPVLTVYANGFAMALLGAGIAAIALACTLLIFLARAPPHNTLYWPAFDLILYIGLATIVRMMGDAPGAALQTSHHIFADNILLTAAEWIWALGTLIGIFAIHLPWQIATGWSILAGSIVLLLLRGILSHRHGSELFARWWKRIHGPTLRHLLTYGLMVVAAQMADFLYAPTNYILIGWLLGTKFVADYNPAVQIDSGLLLLVTAVATTLLPRTALAHGEGNSQLVRRYYIRGTLATAGLLLIAAAIVWLAAPLIFHIWVGNPLPDTCAILPLILIHTVIGGSSAVGRSILLAIGRVRPFTISVLIGGICNVLLGFIFVYYFHWGLQGIVWGTVIAVTGRCLIWLPLYALWAIRREESSGQEAEPVGTLPPMPMQ